MSYIEEVRNRAKRRRSRWNLLLIPAVLLPLVLILVGTMFLVAALHSTIYPGQNLNNARGIASILATVPLLFGGLPLSMLIGNMIVSAVTPARRALDEEAALVPGTSFEAAQSRVRALALYLIPASAVMCAVGSLLPW